ncbi:glycerol dehydratase reactivase beta/small subunit family protein [Vagococcus intermedius]|uniref:Glycerol dehydratase reactivase beta/small subunit family protein n=1 Tax=Vagococcus intermedius TaxID=2991418 RepID=A0AAF0CTD5_9ENTE|nr:glycerol dehydratase reactivase beta/small subunit family protein [Vagococcus intermedius]WEG72514.1 glycerol dehydratase reactivase beta/small subunit family protein [Vagococcus intermedius]WEG74602.1 glycerol dehydratase reactivase beta/small subunit family protein [Vagococcus intermedius]
MSVNPTIYLAKLSDTAPINAILYGIEEEEVPFEIVTCNKSTMVTAAYDLAVRSPLSVGIVLDDHQAMLHYKNLPEDEPLFQIGTEPEELMKLGANAARLVKGIPFKTLKEV